MNKAILQTTPEARIPFLRHRVGFIESRPAVSPVYASGMLGQTGHRTGPEHVQVFRLLGWGENEADAWQMAETHPLWPAQSAPPDCPFERLS